MSVQPMSKSGKIWAKDLTLAASALGALSLVPSRADAAVMRGTGAPISFPSTVGVGAQNFWDVDSNSQNDFYLRRLFTTSGSFKNGFFGSNGLNGFGLAVTSNSFKVIPLAPGFVLGPALGLGKTWSPQANRYASDGYGAPIGAFRNFTPQSDNNYFGFRFRNGTGQTLYGYAQIDFNAPTAKIIDWYYQNDPTQGITVQTAGPSPVPAPIGLAGLAAGAAWTRKLRRRIRESAEAA